MIQKSIESDVKARIWQQEADVHSDPFAVLTVSDLQRFEVAKYYCKSVRV